MEEKMEEKKEHSVARVLSLSPVTTKKGGKVFLVAILCA